MDKDSITLERVYDATAEQIWQALTNEKQMRLWYFPDVEFKPEVGFTTEFNVHHEGKDFLHIWKVTEVVPMKKIAYQWRYGGFPGESLLTFELSSEGSKTGLNLRHENLLSFLPDHNPDLSAANFIEGWTYFMDEGLREFLANQSS